MERSRKPETKVAQVTAPYEVFEVTTAVESVVLGGEVILKKGRFLGGRGVGW